MNILVGAFVLLNNSKSNTPCKPLSLLYRRMCFNVLTHNWDDHAKNFRWPYDWKNDCWFPSPPMTWSTTYYGEHITTVDGNGRDPGMKELLTMGKAAGMEHKVCRLIVKEIQEKTAALVLKYRDIKS